MKIVKTNLPEKSVLFSQKEFQFIDAYVSDFDDKNNDIDIVKIGKMFFSSGPIWIDKLMMFRNKAVKLFGLKVSDSISDKEQKLKNFNCEVNEQIGLFKVFFKNENELILGEDDKHLNFRVSIVLEKEHQVKSKLTISTLVKFNNFFGKLYFIPVKPFHSLVVPAMLKGILKKIKEEKIY